MLSQGWSCFVIREPSASRMTEKLSTGKNASEAAIANARERPIPAPVHDLLKSTGEC